MADEVPTPPPATTNALIFDTSSRVRLGWTEIGFRGDRPKAWDASIGPEARASLRLLSGLFEGKFEVGIAADRRTNFDFVNTDMLRMDLQLGINTGSWSCLVEWKGRDVFEEGFGAEFVELHTYDLRLRKRFAASLFADLPPGLFQASLAAGYTTSAPTMFARGFAEFDTELVQRFGNGFALIVAPKLALNDYADFFGRNRKDTTLSLRIVPTYRFANGITMSLEGQTTFTLSTLEDKTGETWAVTPIIRLQKAL